MRFLAGGARRERWFIGMFWRNGTGCPGRCTLSEPPSSSHETCWRVKAATTTTVYNTCDTPLLICLAAGQFSQERYQCVTKKEAKDYYLLPEGTIAVLKFVERDNPHHSSWTKVYR